MNALIVFGLVVVAMVSCGEVDTLEDLDIEALLQSEDQRKAAFACLMDQAPCGKLQKLRDSIPTMVETKCALCTPKQKEKFDQVKKMLFDKYPEQFRELALKYSPKSD